MSQINNISEMIINVLSRFSNGSIIVLSIVYKTYSTITTTNTQITSPYTSDPI